MARHERLQLVVSGMVAGDSHQGGATWAVLQYVLGLRRLGHDVMLVEPLDRAPNADVSSYFREVTEAFDLRDRAALLVRGTRSTIGVSYDELLRFAHDSDAVFNVAGMLTDDALLDPISTRLYLDLDPAFTQLWQAVEGIDMRLDQHTHFATVGSGIGRGSPVPTCGRDWVTTLPPVVLEHWPLADVIEHDALTTVGNWRGYGSIHHEGVHYGQRAHSMRELIDLPTQTDERFELALDIHGDERCDLDALAANGWTLLDPRSVAGTPQAYAAFVRGSKAELGVAKRGYVVSGSGWFSDRSACYLASGRPVVAQDTGFAQVLPTGEGLFAFHDRDGALAAIDDLRLDYHRHARAAFEMAHAYFDSDRVLAELLCRIGTC